MGLLLERSEGVLSDLGKTRCECPLGSGLAPISSGDCRSFRMWLGEPSRRLTGILELPQLENIVSALALLGIGYSFPASDDLFTLVIIRQKIQRKELLLSFLKDRKFCYKVSIR